MFGKEGFAAKAIEAGGRLTVRSALNPILWLCAIISIPGLVVISINISPPLWLVIFTCAPVLTAIFGFVYLLFVDRDKLQSEDYQLRKMSLELVEQKGDAEPLLLEAEEIEAIPEPKLSDLADGEEDTL